MHGERCNFGAGEACRRAGVRFCTYYSILDWRDPNYPLGDAPGGGAKKSATGSTLGSTL